MTVEEETGCHSHFLVSSQIHPSIEDQTSRCKIHDLRVRNIKLRLLTLVTGEHGGGSLTDLEVHGTPLSVGRGPGGSRLMQRVPEAWFRRGVLWWRVQGGCLRVSWDRVALHCWVGDLEKGGAQIKHSASRQVHETPCWTPECLCIRVLTTGTTFLFVICMLFRGAACWPGLPCKIRALAFISRGLLLLK